MSFHRSKKLWVLGVIFFPPLLLIGLYQLKVITSVYKTNSGISGFIYADRFVKTGEWVFDCDYARLIKREPISVPVTELEDVRNLPIKPVSYGAFSEQEQAAITAITGSDGWQRGLRYLSSGFRSDLLPGFDEYVNAHYFHRMDTYAGQQWELKVIQRINAKRPSRFELTIRPSHPNHYVDHDVALKRALTSCSVNQ